MATSLAAQKKPSKQVRLKPKRRERRCAQCKRIFVWRRPSHIYCSTYCRVKAWAHKRREAAWRSAKSSIPSPSAATSPPC